MITVFWLDPDQILNFVKTHIWGAQQYIGLPAVASVGRPRVLNGVLGVFVPSECTLILILIRVQSSHPLLWAWIPFLVIILYF